MVWCVMVDDVCGDGGVNDGVSDVCVVLEVWL